MQVKTGIDIIEIDRIKEAIEKIGQPFLDRIYTKKEIDYCNKSTKVKYQHFAGRFAAKEATFKALSDFIDGRDDALWKDIEIITDKSGKPKINIDKLIKNKPEKLSKLQSIDISISHDKECAIASVVAFFD